MHRTLFIESSPTLRHILKKSLQSYNLEVHAVDNFQDGLDCITTQANPYDGVILGWPAQDEAITDELLTTLSESPFSELALLILSHESDSAKLAWVSGRPRTAFLLWDNHHDAGLSLGKLLSPATVPAVIEPEQGSDPICILLVDDSPTARVTFRKLLNKGGYKTDAASGADEALKKTQQKNYDIAIIDYFMPDVTGDELCHKLRTQSHTRKIMPAILTSTYHDKVISDSLSAGAVEVMFKNESSELFMARVAAMSRTVHITKHIEQERIRLAGILSSVGDGVYGVSQDGLINFVNPAVKQLLGYASDDDLIGKTPAEVFHRHCPDQEAHDYDVRYLDQAITQGQELHAVESVFSRYDCTPIFVELTIFPLHIAGHQEGAVVAFRDVSMRKLLEDELKWQANHDQLTKLLNRKYLEDALETEVDRLERSEEHSALLYLDLDRFKYINDTIGHSAGDRLLIEISHQLQRRLRKADMLARIGGDEFAILMHNINHDDLFDAADEFRQLLEDYTFTHENRAYKINGSIGVTLIDQSNVSAGEVLANADIACYIAKGKGRNQTHVYSPEQDDKAAMDRELGWSTRLRHALENDNFELHYQPIIALQDVNLHNLPEVQGELWDAVLNQLDQHEVFYEVLIRLNNLKGQTVSPNAFLPTAERFNMMQDIDSWVVNKTLSHLAQMQSTGLSARMSVNLSGQSLDNPFLLEKIKSAIESWSLDPGSIIFEVTESSAINNIDAARQFIDALHKLGCHFALDDFGSGYSSFSHLKNLPVDLIKIDGQFIRDIAHDPMDLAIVTSMVNVAHSLNKLTVAEFVEDATTLRMLKECGVDYVQGYYISTPLNSLPSLEIGDPSQYDDDQDAPSVEIY